MPRSCPSSPGFASRTRGGLTRAPPPPSPAARRARASRRASRSRDAPPHPRCPRTRSEFPSAMCAVPLRRLRLHRHTAHACPTGLNAIETSARLPIRSSAHRASISWSRPASSPSTADELAVREPQHDRRRQRALPHEQQVGVDDDDALARASRPGRCPPRCPAAPCSRRPRARARAGPARAGPRPTRAGRCRPGSSGGRWTPAPTPRRPARRRRGSRRSRPRAGRRRGRCRAARPGIAR